MTGYDVVYAASGAYMEPHFCRIYGDCGGGMSFEDARDEVIKYYKNHIGILEQAKDYDEFCVYTLKHIE